MPKKTKAESTKKTNKNKSTVSSKKKTSTPKNKVNNTKKTQSKNNKKTSNNKVVKNKVNQTKKEKNIKEIKQEVTNIENIKESKKNKIALFFETIKTKFKNIKLSKKTQKKEKVKKERKNIFKKKEKKIEKTKKTNKKQKEFTITKKTKKMLILLVAVCGLILVLEAGYVIYHKIKTDLNTIYYDSFNSVIIDGSDMVAVGSSNFRYSHHYNYTKGLEKAKLVRYDKTGKILFEKQYEKGINTTFSSVVKAKDGYVVVGSGVFSKEEQENGGREAIIVKYDKEGNIVWEEFYQVVTNTRFNKVIATSDGYIAIGQSIYANMEMGNHTTGGGIIVKYDEYGNIVWYNNHGGLKSGNFNDVVEVGNNFYVVGKDGTDFANIVKYDKKGKYVWHKNYRYTDGLGFTGIAYLDNHLYVVGSKKVLPEGTTDDDKRYTENTDALLVKYDLKGKIVTEKTFGGSNFERYNSIVNRYNQLYVVGHITSKDAGLKVNTDGTLMTGLIVEYDKNGNMSRKEVLGGSGDDNLTDITTDGVSLYITGYSNSEDGNILSRHDNGKDYFGKIIKLDSRFRKLLIK